jgi:hypothetical protein
VDYLDTLSVVTPHKDDGIIVKAFEASGCRNNVGTFLERKRKTTKDLSQDRQ